MESTVVSTANVRYPYLVRFRSTHNEFRLPELLSLAKLYDADIKYNQDQAKLVVSQDSKIEVILMHTQ